MTYDFKSYRKPLNKMQKVKRNKELEIQKLWKEQQEKQEQERIRLQNETREEKLKKIALEKEKLEQEIAEEKQKQKEKQDRIDYIKATYTLESLKTKIEEFETKLSTIKPEYKKLCIQQHYQKEYDELYEIYDLIKTEDETEVLHLLNQI